MAHIASSPSTGKPRVWLNRQLRHDLRAYLFLLPWLISLLVFTAYPMFASFYFALTNYNVVSPPEWVGLANFERMFFNDPLFWTAVRNTLYYTLVSVPLSLLVALGLALLLNYAVHGIGIFRTIVYLPTLVPAIASGLLWVVLLNPRNGLINTSLGFLGLPRPGWLQSADWAMPGVIMISLWAGTGSAMLIFLAGLKDVPQSLLDAAKIDGAGNWQQFRYITMPLLTPTIYFNLIMGLISAFQVFGLLLALTGTSGSGPRNSLLVYMVLLYRNAFRNFEMGYASAMAMVLFVVLVLLTLLVVRTSRYWVHYEAEQQRG
jgi:multiple sugar transport system permease protein